MTIVVLLFLNWAAKVAKRKRNEKEKIGSTDSPPGCPAG